MVFTINDFDKCVYFKYFNHACIILCLYVHHILIFGTNLEVIKEIKKLFNNFDIKNLGPIDVMLGIKLIKSNNEFILTQSYYLEQLLKIFNYYNVKLTSTFYDPNLHLREKNIREKISFKTNIFN